MRKFLITRGTKIVKPNGRPIVLKGVNLGGWLMMEGYILGAPNNPEQAFKREFVKKLGPRTLAAFEKS